MLFSRTIRDVSGYNIRMHKLRKLLTVLAGCVFALPAALTAAHAEEYSYTDENSPIYSSDYVYLIDIDTGQVLLDHNGEDRMYPASMTKIMPVIIAIECIEEPDKTKIPITNSIVKGLYEAGATTAGFAVGDWPSVTDCLYGALLPSGADAVNALAVAVDGSIDAFVDHMNEYAGMIGMNHTHFTNATGLHDPDHYTTAEDMAKLMTYALQNETFCEILKAETYTTTSLYFHPAGIQLKSTSWPMINNGTGTYTIAGYLGGKTGFTNPAGRCLASHAEINGMHLVLITGHAYTRGHIKDASQIYNWYDANYQRTDLLSSGRLLGTVDVIDTDPEFRYEIYTGDSIARDLPKDAAITEEIKISDALYAPVEEGTFLASYAVYADGQKLYEKQYYAETAAERNFRAYVIRMTLDFYHRHRILCFIMGASLVLLVGLTAALAIDHMNRVRRRKRKKKRRRKKTKTS